MKKEKMSRGRILVLPCVGQSARMTHWGPAAKGGWYVVGGAIVVEVDDDATKVGRVPVGTGSGLVVDGPDEGRLSRCRIHVRTHPQKRLLRRWRNEVDRARIHPEPSRGQSLLSALEKIHNLDNTADRTQDLVLLFHYQIRPGRHWDLPWQSRPRHWRGSSRKSPKRWF